MEWNHRRERERGGGQGGTFVEERERQGGNFVGERDFDPPRWHFCRRGRPL